jgi:hypothetical protein
MMIGQIVLHAKRTCTTIHVTNENVGLLVRYFKRGSMMPESIQRFYWDSDIIQDKV